MIHHMFQRIVVVSIILLFICSSAGSMSSITADPQHVQSSTLLTKNSIIYVDDDNTLGPWEGSLEHPYQFIQDGLDAASPGDTVFVFNGVYVETLEIHTSLTLEGEDKQATIIDGGNLGSVIAVHADAVHISGLFTVRNSQHPSYDAAGVSVYGDDVSIDHCNFTGNHDGITLYGHHAVIENNTFYENHNFAIYSSYYSTSHLIKHNEFFGNHVGVYLGGVPTLLVGNRIENNTLMNNDIGMYLFQNNQGLHLYNNSFVSNGFGLFVRPTSHLTDVVVRQNSFLTNGIGVFLSFASSGMLLYHNSFIDNVLQNAVDTGENQWNESYPVGGNYWWNYTGVDEFSGPDQDQSGSDGIGDVPQAITGNGNHDQYPLMNPYGMSDNHAPVAVDDTFDVEPDSSDEVLDVLADDYDPNGDDLEISAVDNPTPNGSAHTDGAVVYYSPTPGFEGYDTFSYTIEDEHGANATGMITVHVTLFVPNSVPEAADDQYSVDEDAVLSISAPGVLANDSDDDPDDVLTAVLDEEVDHGVLELDADGSFEYEPEQDYSGEDTFTYFAFDGEEYSAAATVTITVLPVEDPARVPYNPSPSNGSSNRPRSLTLGWDGGDPDDDDLITYDVYFGSSSTPQSVSNNQSSTTYEVDGLAYDTTYYWRVVSWENGGTPRSGPLWHFTTEDDGSGPPSNQDPVADAGGPYSADPGVNILFNASDSYDPDGDVVEYRWRWQSGGSWTDWTSNSTWYHSYASNGTYTVTLEVKDDEGETDTDTASVTIGSGDVVTPEALQAVIGGPYIAYLNEQKTFTGSAVGGQSPYTYVWEFGDGVNASGKTVTHTYRTIGSYTVVLTVTDSGGNQTNATATCSVEERQHPPTRPSVMGDVEGSVGEVMGFGFTSTDANGDNITYYVDWGDSTTSQSLLLSSGEQYIVSHTYNAENMYVLKVYARDDTGEQSSTLEKKVYVDVEVIEINIPGRLIHGFLIDFGRDGTYDVFRNRKGEDFNAEKLNDEEYIINTGSEKWKYNIVTGDVEAVEGEEDLADEGGFLPQLDVNLSFLPIILLGGLLAASQVALILFLRRKNAFGSRRK